MARFAAASPGRVLRLLSASSARGITNRLNLPAWQPFLSALFLLFLLAVGYLLLEMIARRPASFRSVLALPKPSHMAARSGSPVPPWGGEWSSSHIPMALAGSLHVTFWTEPGTLRLMRHHSPDPCSPDPGHRSHLSRIPFRCLIDTTGPVRRHCR